MLAKYPNKRNVIEFVSLDAMVPEDHLLRKIDAAIDFDKIYDFVEDLYCEDNGRPSVDPVILFKIVLIQHIYAIPSLRRTLEEINMNMAYRWFLGIPINDPIPHFSTVSHNFKHRFSQKTIEYVFRWILNTAAEEGYLDTEAIFIDGTHIKASANTKKKAKKSVPKQTKRYAKELFEEINKDREEHDKKPFDDGTFQPNAAITREQMAAILRNYAQYKGLDVTASGDLVNYSDANSVSTWAKDSVEWAVGSGLIGGYEDSTLRPQGTTTRAEVASVLQRYLAN